MQYCFARALRATSNRKANRVIAVNELYVLLSDQTVNVTHKTNTYTHSWGGDRAHRHPEYLSHMHLAHKY